MSGDGEGKAYEVERRVRGHMPIPPEFTLSKTYVSITDYYMSVDPAKRIRASEVVVNNEVVKKGKVTGKKAVSGEVAEYETSVGDSKLMMEIWGEPEVLVVSGSRLAYSNGKGIEITHDNVYRLGKFTEFEIVAKETDEERKRASEAIEEFVTSLGIEKNYCKPYHHQILQLEILSDIYRTPVTKKELTAQKMAAQYKGSVRLVRQLCEELKEMGWVEETNEKTWLPVEAELPDILNSSEQAEPGKHMVAGTLKPLEMTYVEGMVAGILPLCPALEARKIAPFNPPKPPIQPLPPDMNGGHMKQPPKQ